MNGVASLNLFEPFLQCTPNAIAMFDRQMNHLLVSRQWLQDYGLSENAIKGRSLSDTIECYQISPSLLSHWQKTYPYCLQGQKFQDEGNYVFTVQGTKEWLQWEMSPWTDDQGNIGGVILSSRFITPWKQQEDLLKQTETRFLNLSANLPGMLFQFLLYQDGTIAYPFISSGCSDLFEIAPQTIQNEPQTILNCIYPEDLQSYNESIALSARLLTPFYWEGRILTPSGKTKWVEASSRPEQQPNGAVLWDGIVIDTTPRKIAEIALQQYQDHLTDIVQKRTKELTQANEQLQEEIHAREAKALELEEALQTLKTTQAQLIQTEKMSSLGQLVAGVAHEINNPINFIFGNINYMENYTRDLITLIHTYGEYNNDLIPEIQTVKEQIDWDFIQEDFPQILHSMKSGAERIQNIITSLKTFSHHNEAELKWVDIHKGLDSTLMILSNRLNPSSNNGKIEVVKQYESLPKIECYPGQLNQVFLYLLNNAIDAVKNQDNAPNNHDFHPEHNGHFPQSQPQIIITTKRLQNHQISITIKDNGTGIEPKIQSQLFDPFFTTKPVGVGTGLGLTISYQIIVENHQGEIQLNSQPGQGCELTLTLPIKTTPKHQNRLYKKVLEYETGLKTE